MPEKFLVKISESAEEDIKEIWSYIAEDSLEEANRFVEQLEDQAAHLENFPQRCPFIPENKASGTRYRHLIYGNYRTIFQVSGKVVLVMRILHGARLLDPSFFEEPT